MKTVVFLGPTLPVDTARKYLDAKFLPPVEQGDVLRLLRDRPDAIGIIDGYFQRVPSVWHKEILTALAEGVYVAGAASMGALRAAELAHFGMTGIGDIFEKFHSGEYTDDDEVALAHAPASGGYRALSEAMVNIRDCCRAASEAGIIETADVDGLLRIAKALHFTQRHWQRILADAVADGMNAAVAERMRAFKGTMRHDAKERDAIALLKHLAGMEDRPERPVKELRVEQTVFLADLKAQISREAAPEPEQAPGTPLNVARKKVLLGLLARREAVRRGLMIGHDDVRNMTGWFRGTYALEDDARFVTWIANHALPEADFQFAMRRFTEVTRVEEACGSEIDRELDTYLRVYSAAAQNHAEAPVWVQLSVALGRGACGAPESARALFDALAPVLARLRRRGILENFHFVRKPPDVRLRFRAAAPDRNLLPHLAPVFAKLQQSGSVVSAVRSVYEPEARVFGGAEAAEAAHEYFDADTRQWMVWDNMEPEEQAVTTEQLCAAALNDLFEQFLGCGGEVWDTWSTLRDVTAAAKGPNPMAAPANGEESLAALARTGGPKFRALVKAQRAANQAFAESIRQVWECGRLEMGLRSLLATVAMFHCNRFGVDGAKQCAIAEAACATWHPANRITREAHRARRSATFAPDHARASRSAQDKVLD